MESKIHYSCIYLEQHLFEIEIFGNIINVFAVAFDQFNVCLHKAWISIHLNLSHFINIYYSFINVFKKYYFTYILINIIYNGHYLIIV